MEETTGIDDNLRPANHRVGKGSRFSVLATRSALLVIVLFLSSNWEKST